jgi:hypothetical protein
MAAPLTALDAAPNQSFAISSAAIDRLSITGSLDATVDLSRRASRWAIRA